ncbi:MAG: ABC transporter ATP-binding protein [Methanomicrobiales archaeon]|nr:ABC transporter ATP-binding protein [Methanomicrobiales archaeon]
MALVIEAKSLEKRFGETTAVRNVNFTVEEGEVFGFLGPNGAGKTSTMRMIQCASPKTSGSLEVFGLDVGRFAREIRRRIGVVPQESNLDPDFTVFENLLIYASYFDISSEEARNRAEELLSYVKLEEKRYSRIDQLSGGMRRRLVLARALINNPSLLILDEPTTGLDPQARHLIWDKLRELVGEGRTIVLTTHYMEEAAHLCDRLVIMDQGSILVGGTPEELVRKYAGTHVIEVGSSPDAIACLERHGIPFEITGGYIQIFSEQVQEVASHLLKECPEHEMTSRPATLEDVFLRLTGRRLRE